MLILIIFSGTTNLKASDTIPRIQFNVFEQLGELEHPIYPQLNNDGSVTYSPMQINFLRNLFNSYVTNNTRIDTLTVINNKFTKSDSMLLFQVEQLRRKDKNNELKIANLYKVINNDYILKSEFEDFVNLSIKTSESLNKYLKKARVENWVFRIGVPAAIVVAVLLSR